MATDTPQHPGELNRRTRLAYERTRLAYENTMMAWVRTAISMITFGFSVYKFFQFELQQSTVPPIQRLIGPREFGLLLIICGLVSLSFGIIEHVRLTRQLRVEYAKLPPSLSMVPALLIWIVGVVALLAVLFRQ